jgi:hypothetical protein
MSFWVRMGSPMNLWIDVDATDVIRTGSLVCYDGHITAGAFPMGIATGTCDSTDKEVPFGVVIGSNDRTPVYDATSYLCNYTTGVTSIANIAARDWIGAEGQHQKGDGAAKVEVAVIAPGTVITGRIFKSAYGEAPDVLTVTTASSDGGITAMAANTHTYTGVADLHTAYCRTGANRGIYRICNNTTATALAFTTAMPNAIAVDDTFVAVPLRVGHGHMQLDGEGMYINGEAAINANYFGVTGLVLDLETAGNETYTFMFQPAQLGWLSSDSA